MSDGNDFWGDTGKTSPQRREAGGLRGGPAKDGPGFLSKEVAQPDQPQRPEGAEFWDKAEKSRERDQAERDALLKDPDLKRRRRRRLVKRTLLSITGVVVLALVLGVVFLPQIAASLAPGLIEDAAAESIEGRVAVGDVSLSWGGPQRVEGVRLLAPDGKEVARATVEASAGFFGLVRGNLDLGDVTISGGKAEIIRERDGSTNLQRAIATRKGAATTKPKSKPADAPPPTLPDSLRAKVTIKGFDATITDRAGDATTVTVRDLDLKVTIDPGASLPFEASGKVFKGLVTGRTPDAGGELTLSGRVESWSRDDGQLTLARAKGKAEVDLASLPTVLLDVLAPGLVADEEGRPVALAAALGPALTLRAAADGDGSSTGVEFDLAFEHATAKGALAYTANDVRISKPLALWARGSAIKALAPALVTRAANAGVTLDTWPDITIAAARGGVPIPGASGLDFRGLPLDATIALTATSGKVVVDPSQPGKPFSLDPLTLALRGDDLAGTVRLTASTRATLDGHAAGTLEADVAASRLLDAKGAFAGVPGGLDGRASLGGIATAMLQPWASAAGLDLPRDIGPNLDITLAASGDASRASTVTGAAGVVELPPTTLRLEVTAQHLALRGSVEQTPTALRSVGEGVTLTLSRAGAIAAGYLDPRGGWSLEPAPDARGVVTITGLTIPRDTATGTLKLDQAAANVAVTHGGLTLRQSGGEAIVVRSFRAGLGLRGGGKARLTLDADASHGSQAFGLRAALDATDLYAAKDGGGLAFTPPMRLRPAGTLDITGAPPALAGLFMARPEPGSLDTPTLIADALAGPTDIRIAFKGVAGRPEAVDAGLDLKSPKAAATLGVVVDASRASLRAGSVNTTLTPAMLATLLRTYAPALSSSLGDLALVGPARLQASFDAIDLPLRDDGSLALDRTGTAKARVTLAGQTLVDGLRVANADGSSRALGRVGVEDLTIRAEVPVAAMVAPPLGEERTARFTLEGQVLGASGPAVLTLAADGHGEFSHGAPKGRLGATVRVTRANTRIVEQWIGREGLLTGLMGPSADVETTIDIAPPETGYHAGDLLREANVEAGLTVASARLRADRPVRVRLGRERVDLVEPATITISPDAVAATEYLRGLSAGGATLEVLDAESLTLRLAAFSIPRAVRTAATPGAPAAAARDVSDAASINLTLDAPGVTLRSADQQRIILTGSKVSVVTERLKADKDGKFPPGGPPVTFAFEVAEAKVGDAAPAKGLSLNGRVTSLFASDGAMDLTQGRLNMTGQVPAAPTALLDAMLDQDGAILEALGPVIAVKVTVERLPLAQPPRPDGSFPRYDPAPLIDLEATSPRATMSFRGTVNEGLFVSERPLEVSVIEMTSAFVKRYVGAMPLLGVAEKTSKDAPALLRATGMTVPLNKDWSRLNASIDLDPGECRFESSGLFSDILKVAQQKTTGTAGTRIDTLRVTIRNGISTYDRWRVPLGEFTVETMGVVNLTNAEVRATRPDGKEVVLGPRSLDVVTWIPAGAVTDRGLGFFNIGLGSMFARLTPGLLEPLTMLPFRTTGPMDKPTTSADSELVGEGVKNQLKKLDPRRLLEGLKPSNQGAPPK